MKKNEKECAFTTGKLPSGGLSNITVVRILTVAVTCGRKHLKQKPKRTIWFTSSFCFTGSSLRREGRPKTPVKRPKSVGTVESIARTPGSSSDFKLEVGMSVFCNNELGKV